MSYTGLPPALRRKVYERDNHRCRWCGATNQGADIHHVRYRRGAVDDVLDNLVTLCRTHHTFVHDSYRIPKQRAQEILRYVISDSGRGSTGASLFRVPEVPLERTDGRLLPGAAGPFRLR